MLAVPKDTILLYAITALAVAIARQSGFINLWEIVVRNPILATLLEKFSKCWRNFKVLRMACLNLKLCQEILTQQSIKMMKYSTSVLPVAMKPVHIACYNKLRLLA